MSLLYRLLLNFSMSRSKRKPFYTDQNRGKPKYGEDKRIANKAVRNEDEVVNGKAYRKVSNSWDIRDWSFYEPKDPKARRK